MNQITIRRATGAWVVRAAGAVIAESAAAKSLSEGSAPDVIYFPPQDVAMAMLDPSPTTSTCPWKGRAAYFSMSAPEGVIRDIAWSYPDPSEDARAIAGHLAFYADKVTIERI